MSGRYESRLYPTVSIFAGTQHLRKGRLYKIRMASVNAQSNLVHGESVWLESETRRIADIRCQATGYKGLRSVTRDLVTRVG